MIFITVGSQKFQFDRLLKAVDELVERGMIQEDIFAQTGYSDYKPKHYLFKPFLDRAEFEAFQEKADLVITHGGTGAIIGAVKKGKKVIAVPRLARYGEHVDDHQLQLLEQFGEQELIYAVQDCDKLAAAIETVKVRAFHSYQSNTAKYIERITAFIEE